MEFLIKRTFTSRLRSGLAAFATLAALAGVIAPMQGCTCPSSLWHCYYEADTEGSSGASGTTEVDKCDRPLEACPEDNVCTDGRVCQDVVGLGKYCVFSDCSDETGADTDSNTSDASVTDTADASSATTTSDTTTNPSTTTSSSTDPTTSGTSTSTSTNTTGDPTAVCGNGVVEGGEGCDFPPCKKRDICVPLTGRCQMTAEPCLTDVPPTEGEADRCSTTCQLLEAPDGTSSSTGGGAVDPEQSAQEAYSFLSALLRT